MKKTSMINALILIEEIRKLTTSKGEDYTTGCLLDYDYI